MNTQYVQVTDTLRGTLADIHDYLDSHKDTRWKDADHYVPTVQWLECLARKLLAATSVTPLLSQKLTGARIDLDPGHHLARRLSGTVGYLRETAAPLVADPTSLNRYEGSHTTMAAEKLTGLYEATLASVRTQMRADMRELSAQSPGDLIDLAAVLADKVRP